MLCITSGCHRTSEVEWNARYQETRRKLWYGYFDEALREADDNYRRSQGQSVAWGWRFQTLKAQALVFQGRTKEALALLEPEVPSDLPIGVAQRKRIVQADAFCRVGERDKAEAILGQDTEVHSNDDRVLQAELSLTRGRCALPANAIVAKQYFVASSRFAHGRDEFIEANALLMLGVAMSSGQSYELVINTYRSGLEVTDSPLLREKILGNLAVCYANLGDWRQSISLDEQAEKLAAQINNRVDQQKWLLDLGRAHFAVVEIYDAERYYLEALAIARNIHTPDGLLRCLHNLTQLALQRHALKAAEQYGNEESTLSLNAEDAAYVSFDAAGIAMEKGKFSEAESLLREILRTRADDSLRLTTKRELGNAYWREGKIDLADQTFHDGIDDAERVIAHLPPQFQMSFLDEDPFYDSYVRFLNAQNKKVKALETAERGRGQILSRALSEKQDVFDLKKVQAILRERKQIALAYSLTNEESFLWVVTPAEVKLFQLPPHKKIAQLVDAYYNEVVNHPRAPEDSPSCQEFYHTMIQPAEHLIPKGSHVVIIPSKILSVVSFDALIVPGDHPHYWIDDVEVETASSLALLAHSKPANAQPDRRRKQLFVLGDPVEADKSLRPPQHGGEEIDHIHIYFHGDQVTIVSGAAAIPQAYRANKPGDFRLIHIDAHSIPSEVNPLDSYIVLSPTADGSYKLSAHEIEGIRLQADLVTISACVSAGNRWYQGEGIVGLGWAFLHAGAHQVVASLWAVDDASTPQLMDDFYRELSQGQPASKALRDAKLHMLHSSGQRSRPYYWASLQLYTGS